MTIKPRHLLHPGMTDHERRVTAMMLGFGQDCPQTPTVGDEKTRISRSRMKLEETLEYAKAAGLRVKIMITHGQKHTDRKTGRIACYVNVDELFEYVEIEGDPDGKPDLAEMIDAVVDDSVVNTGTAVAHGVRLTPLLEAVDENNLMKIANGKLDDFGKFQKAPNHPKVNLSFALALQGYDPANDPNMPNNADPASHPSTPIAAVSGEPLPEQLFNVRGTETGRTSSEQPNEASICAGGDDATSVLPEQGDEKERWSWVRVQNVVRAHRKRDCTMIYTGPLIDAVMLALRNDSLGFAEKILRVGLEAAGMTKPISIEMQTIELTGPGDPGPRGVVFKYRRLG